MVPSNHQAGTYTLPSTHWNHSYSLYNRKNPPAAWACQIQGWWEALACTNDTVDLQGQVPSCQKRVEEALQEPSESPHALLSSMELLTAWCPWHLLDEPLGVSPTHSVINSLPFTHANHPITSPTPGLGTCPSWHLLERVLQKGTHNDTRMMGELQASEFLLRTDLPLFMKISVSTYMYVYIHICASMCRGQRRTSGSLSILLFPWDWVSYWNWS